MSGKHIELFLVDGVPGGLTTAEVAGWTGHVLAGPRSDLVAILKRDEAQRNGAYVLLGDDDTAVGGIRCYIGRSENLAQRLRNHDANKTYWDRVVLITARDDAFNEGHWGYLEAELLRRAKEAERADIMNDNTPQGRKLSEAQRSDMQAFVEQLEVVLPVLGVSVLRTRRKAATSVTPVTESPIFRLALPKKGVDASAQADGDEFVMLEGSRVVGAWRGRGRTDSTMRAYAALTARFEKLVADGSIRLEGDVGVLTRDVPFTSPSAAGAIATGRSCNGRVSWTWEGGTYADWERRGLDLS